MYSYTIYYFDRFNRYIDKRTIISPGDNVTAIQKLVREQYWDPQSISPAKPVIAIALCEGHEPVLVVNENA